MMNFQNIAIVFAPALLRYLLSLFSLSLSLSLSLSFLFLFSFFSLFSFSSLSLFLFCQKIRDIQLSSSAPQILVDAQYGVEVFSPSFQFSFFPVLFILQFCFLFFSLFFSFFLYISELIFSLSLSFTFKI